MEIKNSVIIITGASSGIGKACAQLLCREGASVYGLSRGCTTGSCSDGLHCVQCDVTSDKSVHDAFEYILRQSGRIDGLVCCAGSGIAGAVEDTAQDEAEALMQVNYFGAVRCAREALHFMRPARKGTIVFISSVAALFGIPFQAFYSAGKYALDGTSEALRNEVHPFNIKICSVLPGDTRTGFTSARRYTRATVQGTEYKKGFCSALNAMVRDEINGAPPQQAARCVLRALKRRNPPPRIIVGFGYKLLAFLRRLLPGRLVCAVLRLIYCRGKEQSALWSFDRDVKKQ